MSSPFVQSYRTSNRPFRLEKWSFRKILEMHQLKQLDLHPAFQREEVAPIPWKRKFITDFMRGICHSVLTFRDLDDSRMQSIDGLQRVTTGIEFVNNKFKTLGSMDIPVEGRYIECPSTYWQDMYKDKNGDSLMNRFLDQEFIVIIYDKSMTDEEAAETFQVLNFNNSLNDQEWRQARTHILAEYVRNNARLKKLLPLFDLLPIKSKRMNYDEFLVRCIAYEYMHQQKSNSLGIYSRYNNKELLDNLYNSISLENKDVLSSLTSKVEDRLNFIKRLFAELDDRQKKIIGNKFSKLNTLFTFTYALEESYGKSYKIDSYSEFAKTIIDAFLDLQDLKKHGDKTRDKTRFTELQSLFAPHEISERNSLLLSYIQSTECQPISKDEKRGFAISDMHRKWREQGERSSYSGKKIKFEDAVGGHIVPHSKGGRTTYDNLTILTKEENSKLGDTDMTEIVKKFETKGE